MTNPQFKPAPSDHEVEIMIDGKTHKGRYHIDRDNIVVSYQGASKMAAHGADNETLAKTLLGEIVKYKQKN